MPPKGYKKGYIKDPETGKWIDPREKESSHGVVLIKSKGKVDRATANKVKKKQKDDLGPTTKNIKDTSEYPTVIISWKDNRGRARTTQYVMSDLSINEAISEIFSGAKKETRIHMSLDGTVLEKQ